VELKKLVIAGLGLAAGIALLSCTTPPPDNVSRATESDHEPVDWKTVYSQLGATGGKVFTLDSKASAIRIYAFRGGAAAKMGHNHVLSAPQFTGYVYLPPDGVSGARFDLEFRLDQLEIDNPEFRSGLGKAFSSTLSPEAIIGTRDHMLGGDNLQADRYPFVGIHSLQVAGETPIFAAKVQVQMHGQERELWIPLTVEGLPDRLSVVGSFVLRQSDFDVRPYSVLGGMLAVQDEVVVEFKLLGN